MQLPRRGDVASLDRLALKFDGLAARARQLAKERVARCDCCGKVEELAEADRGVGLGHYCEKCLPDGSGCPICERFKIEDQSGRRLCSHPEYYHPTLPELRACMAKFASEVSEKGTT